MNTRVGYAKLKLDYVIVLYVRTGGGLGLECTIDFLKRHCQPVTTRIPGNKTYNVCTVSIKDGTATPAAQWGGNKLVYWPLNPDIVTAPGCRPCTLCTANGHNCPA